MKFRTIVSVFSSVIFLAACAQTPNTSKVQLSPLTQWRMGVFEPNTTIKTSARINEGVLANGMRYFIVENQTPKNEVVVRMRVGVGSMYEASEDAGIAHFLEHMAFNGSKNVPEGEMISILERYGLRFGADTNASTSFEETIYKLDLPKNDAETLETALFLMRETASNLTIEPDAVVAEIPVVQSEYEARNNIYMEAYKASLAQWSKGLHYIDRFPIGTLATISGLTAESVKAFYDTHYYPANTQLIIVGDIDAKETLNKIEAAFGDWDKPNINTGFEAGSLVVNDDVNVATFSGPNLPTQVSLFYVTPARLQPDTIVNRRANYVEQIANGILSYRLNSLVLAGNAPFEGVGSSHGLTFNQADVSQVIAQMQPDKWAESLSALVLEIRRMVEFGVSEQELIRQVKAIRNSLVTTAQSEDTLPSGAFANAILGNITTGEILNEPSASLDLFVELMETFSVEEINEVITRQFTRIPPTIFIQFAEQETALPSSNEIKGVYDNALTQSVTANEAQAIKAFAYTQFGEPGKVIEKSYNDAYDYSSYTFANGVRLNVKATELVKEKVLIRVRYGSGTKALPQSLAGLNDLYNFYIVGGLGEHSVNELRELLSDKNVSLSFSADFNGYGGTFSTSNDTLSEQLQLITAYITDPGYSETVLPLFRKNVEQGAKQRKNTIAAVKSYEVSNAIYGDDHRMGPAPVDAVLARDFNELKTVLKAALERGPMTITVVGDINVDNVVDEIAKTLGSLDINVPAPRHEWIEGIRLQAPNNVILTHEGNPENASLTRYFKTTDNSDLSVALQLRVLAAVLQLKVQDVIREELGASYSPSARASGSNDIKGDGMLFLDTLTTPAQLALVETTFDELIAGVKVPGNITEDEVKRAIEPMLASLKGAKERNGFWLSRLSALHTKPDTFAKFEAAPDIYSSITPEDLTQLAQRYLIAQNQIDVKVLPTKIAEK